MNNVSFQNKRRDIVIERQFEQLSSLFYSSIYQVINTNRIKYSTIIIFISMLFLFVGTVFIESIVFKIGIFLIFSLIAAPITAIIISIDKSIFIIKNISKNEHINKIKSSKEFYEKIDPFEDDDVKMLVKKEDFQLLKFMDNYVEGKFIELNDSIEKVFSELMSSLRKVSKIDNSEFYENESKKKIQELETLINEYEDNIDIFNYCKISIAMIYIIENLSNMSIGEFQEKINSIEDENGLNEMKRTGIVIGNTIVLSEDIQSMINDKEIVEFMMNIYHEDFSS